MSEVKPKQLPPAPSEADVLRRMLNTPPEPRVTKPKAKPKKAKKADK
jgi:hypothetical protein